VPVAEGLFNKPRTNLLLQRSSLESGAGAYVDGDLAFRTKPQIAVVAVARELVGFLWAVMQDPHAAAVAA